MEGDSKGYYASELAKNINAASDDDLQSLLSKAALNPPLFKQLFDTFHGEELSSARLKQQILKLNVHPDKAAECIKIFVNSLCYAKLAELLTEDTIKLVSLMDSEPEEISSVANLGKKDESNSKDQSGQIEDDYDDNPESTSPTKSLVKVNIDIDPSMDPEKLEMHLKLLKKYGAI